MTSYYVPVSETGHSALPESLAGLNVRGGFDRVLGATVTKLNQTQYELEASKRQIESLKEQLAALEKVATTDLLTGLKNRRGFEDVFSREIDKTRRGKSIGGVLVVIDLDSFKAINDTYGHQAGDACLKLVGETLAHEIRVMDSAARLGGDEFVILMTETTQGNLLTRVQNIAWKLNHLFLEWDDKTIAIHASVGMKPYTKGDEAEAVFAEADTNMYADKKRARL